MVDVNNYLVSTPLSREIANLPSIDCIDQPETYYNPYQLFCLKTRLYPIIYQLLGDYYDLSFVTRIQSDIKRLQLCVQVLYLDCPAVLEQDVIQTLEAAVLSILEHYPHHCLLFDTNLDLDDNIPANWMTSIFPYVYDTLGLEINTYTEPLYENGYLYVQLADPTVSQLANARLNPRMVNKPSYDEKYDKLYISILQQLSDYYAAGTIVCDRDFALKWNLEQINDSEEDVNLNLYQAKWFDARVGNMTVFLESRLLLQGQKEVVLSNVFAPFENNEVQKHFVAAELLRQYKDEFVPSILENNVILFPLENYNDLFYKMNAIYLAKQNAVGFVYIRKLYDVDKINTYNSTLSASSSEDISISIAYYYNLDSTITYSVVIPAFEALDGSEVNKIANILDMADLKF